MSKQWTAATEVPAGDMHRGRVLKPELYEFHLDVMKRLSQTKGNFAIRYTVENRRVAETLRRYVQQRVRAAQGNRAVRSSVRDDAGTDGVYLFFRRGENWNGGV